MIVVSMAFWSLETSEVYNMERKLLSSPPCSVVIARSMPVGTLPCTARSLAEGEQFVEMHDTTKYG